MRRWLDQNEMGVFVQVGWRCPQPLPIIRWGPSGLPQKPRTAHEKRRQREYMRAYYRTPNGKKKIYAYINARRWMGNDVINPDYANSRDFQGHHIDNTHIIYIPKQLHRMIGHSQKNPKSMERINTKAYLWVLTGII